MSYAVHQVLITLDIPGIKHRIVKYLPAYLLKFGYVELEGLGRFKLEAHASFIDHAAARIYPPYYDVSFEQGQYSQQNIYVAYLSQRLGLDDALIAEVMSTYTESIRQQLNHEESVSVEGLGTLLVRGTSNLIFDSDDAFWGMSAIKDLSVSFTPVPRLKDQVTKQQPSTLVNELPVIDQAPEILETPAKDVIAEDWETALAEEVEQEVFENEARDVKAVVEVEEHVSGIQEDVHDQPLMPTATEAYSVAADHTRTELPPVIAADAVVNHEKENTRHRFIVPVMLGLLFLIAIPLFFYLTDRDEKSATQSSMDIPKERLNQNPQDAVMGSAELGENAKKESTTSPSATVTEEVKEELESKSQELLNEKVENNDSKQQNNSVISSNNRIITSGECVIIVGAFNENANMRQMMSKLEAKGFRVYVDSTRSLSRVGAYSACQSEELNRNLSIIKSDIEPSSWILNR